MKNIKISLILIFVIAFCVFKYYKKEYNETLIYKNVNLIIVKTNSSTEEVSFGKYKKPAYVKVFYVDCKMIQLYILN